MMISEVRITQLRPIGTIGEEIPLTDRLTHEPAGSYVRVRHGWTWTEAYRDGMTIERRTDEDGHGLFTRDARDGTFRQDVGLMQFCAPQAAASMRRRLHRMHE